MKKHKRLPFPVNRLESDLAKSGHSKEGESDNDPVLSSMFLKTLRYAVERGLTSNQLMFIVNSVIDLTEKLGKDELIIRMENVLTVMNGDVEYLKRHPEAGRKEKK